MINIDEQKIRLAIALTVIVLLYVIGKFVSYPKKRAYFSSK